MIDEAEIDELNVQWHDHPIMLDTIRHDAQNKQLVFQLHQNADKPATLFNLIIFGFRQVPVQLATVTLGGVSKYDIHNTNGEVELYVKEIVKNPSSIRISGVNGDLEIAGEDLKVISIEKQQRLYIRNMLTILFIEIGWKKKLE